MNRHLLCLAISLQTLLPGPWAESQSTDTPNATESPAASSARVIPSGTKILVLVKTPINSESAKEGDALVLSVVEDMTVDGAVPIHAGDTIEGTVALVKRVRVSTTKGHGGTGVMTKRGIRLKFESLSTADGGKLPITAGFVSRGGVVHARRGLKDLTLIANVKLPLLLGTSVSYSPPRRWGPKAKREAESDQRRFEYFQQHKDEYAQDPHGEQTLVAPGEKPVDLRPGDEMKVELEEDLKVLLPFR